MFNALVLDRSEGRLQVDVQELVVDDLPDAGPQQVHVEVLYSSVNYKDALAVTGAGKIIRGGYPIVPGIDLVGRVLESKREDLEEGELVIGTGWQLGEVDWGGYTQRAKVDGSKLVRLPKHMTPKEAMVAGTAGFTAMLSVMALEDHDVDPDDGEIVVTGASGGGGSMAITLLDTLDYEVVASSGSEEAHQYLRDRGADRIVHRSAFEDGPERPMESGKWAGAVDAVGGQTLATLLAQLQRHGTVASYGNAAGHELNTSVFPFILRGVNLIGIDSNTCPNKRRQAAWRRMASVLSSDDIQEMTARTVGLDEVPEACEKLLSGDIRGRVVVDLQ
ncbi:oxidoreductase [Salinibacter sp. 10B]|uniref:MDR family oxidoreductase n=1 Tax=Salinibacter sp. 10B TaxID=1923971 RepID=UPI000CF3CF43|nr:MDR family oxidoreductase [Salinibacter sp. 10B]PQJ36126.1 oxidoreductase [Salinibacter sp. 10B]